MGIAATVRVISLDHKRSSRIKRQFVWLCVLLNVQLLVIVRIGGGEHVSFVIDHLVVRVRWWRWRVWARTGRGWNEDKEQFKKIFGSYRSDRSDRMDQFE